MRWARPLGPRRLAGTNPRAQGTDLRSRALAPRALRTNRRLQDELSEAARRPRIAQEPPRRRPGPHLPSRPLEPRPYGAVGDSEYRRRAVAVSGPCARCGDNLWTEGPAGAELCLERVTPPAEDLPP